MADVNHLLAETEHLSVKDHFGLISKQFLASTYREDHASHSVIKLPTGTRPGRKNKVQNLQSRYDDDVRPFLVDGVLPKASYKRTIKKINIDVVTECKKKLVNTVLGTAPPDIDSSEKSFPCVTRSTLNQLRSSYSKDLKSYQVRIGTSPDDVCPVCRTCTPRSTFLSAKLLLLI
jgi:hypothetical protein